MPTPGRSSFRFGLKTFLVVITATMLTAGALAYLLRYIFRDTYFIIDF